MSSHVSSAFGSAAAAAAAAVAAEAAAAAAPPRPAAADDVVPAPRRPAAADVLALRPVAAAVGAERSDLADAVRVGRLASGMPSSGPPRRFLSSTFDCSTGERQDRQHSQALHGRLCAGSMGVPQSPLLLAVGAQLPCRCPGLTFSARGSGPPPVGGILGILLSLLVTVPSMAQQDALQSGQQGCSC